MFGEGMRLRKSGRMSASIAGRINFVLRRLLRANCEILMTHFAKGYGKGRLSFFEVTHK